MKTTIDVSEPPTPPIPFRVIFVGVAETKEIELAAAPATFTVVVTLAVPTEIVMVSVPTPPAAVYVDDAFPFTDVTGEMRVAVLAVAKFEEKLTPTGVVKGLPLLSVNVTVIPVEPPGARLFKPT